jgi:hypothetical protein
VDGAVYKFDSWLGDEGAVVRVLDRRCFRHPGPSTNNGSASLFGIKPVKRSRAFISKTIQAADRPANCSRATKRAAVRIMKLPELLRRS